MSPPLLKLAFVQGPRDGDSIEFKPGSIVRIGRVVRGNEIAIKDAGISTKHLRIVSDSENWIIHDLGSSNGTVLNSDALDSESPFILGHGDMIKLGENTSIVVNFVTNNKRQANADPERDPVPFPVETVQEKPKHRGRPPKQVKASNDEAEPQKITHERVSRSTRSKKNEIGEDSFMELDMILKQSRKVRVKKTEMDKKTAKTVVETEVKSDTVKDNEAQEGCSERIHDKEEVVDLDKMTLGGWFDHMELQLPKQINEETEKVIQPMRSKASRVRNYIIAEQKQQARGKALCALI